MGYDTRGPIPFYIVRNSWGRDFGNKNSNSNYQSILLNFNFGNLRYSWIPSYCHWTKSLWYVSSFLFRFYVLCFMFSILLLFDYQGIAREVSALDVVA